MSFLHTFFSKSAQWCPIYWIWTDRFADSHDEPNTDYLKMCEAPNRVQFFLFCKTFTTQVLTFI